MEHLQETFLDLDADLDRNSSEFLNSWDWKTETGSFKPCRHAASPQSLSPASSFNSFFSASPPHLPAGTGGLMVYNLRDLAHTSLGNCEEYEETCTSLQGRTPHLAKPKMSAQRRRKASEREKLRMRTLANALHTLRNYLPPVFNQQGQPLTKIQTLKYTIQYINELSALLNDVNQFA
ncbi:mesogenin-1 [Latimeria chalumnae]|uniref:mesogenin-1 n=1 Tax=Latimeria chalumnae TaxID=7897 RepID=UPI0003C175F2|nr:PREDICTED: mesogenin-1 [Latimeria chalumnae]|eukprot:XP_005997585.1 PREDICTED: mesogenin-1 [Latimeria chalumnae]